MPELPLHKSIIVVAGLKKKCCVCVSEVVNVVAYRKPCSFGQSLKILLQCPLRDCRTLKCMRTDLS